MAKSSALVSALAAALIAGTFGLAHAQGAGGASGGTGGTSGSAGTTSIGNPPGTAGVTGSGGGHRQPRAGDLPDSSQGYKPDRRDRDVDRKIGSICRGC